MRTLKGAWKSLEKILFFIGDVITAVFLVVFYFTVFAVVAIPFRIMAKNPLGIKHGSSNWIEKSVTPSALGDFMGE